MQFVSQYPLLRADTLKDIGDTHLIELSQLAEKDPEFYKYLQENDRELLEFDPDKLEDDDEDDEGSLGMDNTEMDVSEDTPVLTKEELRRLQKALLEVRPVEGVRISVNR